MQISQDAALIANQDSRLPIGIYGDIFRPSPTDKNFGLDYSRYDLTVGVLSEQDKNRRQHKRIREKRHIEEILYTMEKIAYDAIAEAIEQDLGSQNSTLLPVMFDRLRRRRKR